jgi:hypothetical protein
MSVRVSLGPLQYRFESFHLGHGPLTVVGVPFSDESGSIGVTRRRE